MHLLTYSFARWGDNKLNERMALTDDPLAWLIRKRQQDESVCIVWVHELSPLEARRLNELKAAGVEVET